MYFLYNVLLSISLLFLIPYYGIKIFFTGKYRKSIRPKLGLVSSDVFKAMTGSPRIWLHAVSVGEVTAAAPIINAIRAQLPAACIVLSTSTETGHEMAKTLIKEVTSLIYFPLDFPFIVRKMIGSVHPDIFVAVETEIWPNFISAARKRKIRIVLANGRISPRSFQGYYATRFFWKKVLGLFDFAAVISETDAKRLCDLGMQSDKIKVLGNSKYDSLASRTDPQLHREMAEKLNVPDGVPVFVAGSTHPGEEEIILNVYRQLLNAEPNILLIIAPRHIERGAEVVQAANMAGFNDTIRLSEISANRTRLNERIIIIDKIGELFKTYSLATIVYCGGSLVPRGGQNILEAAAWGKTVFFGPHMDDFLNEKKLLEECGVGITVHNEKELLKEALDCISNPQKRELNAQAARKAILANRGASMRYADLIISVLRGC